MNKLAETRKEKFVDSIGFSFLLFIVVQTDCALMSILVYRRKKWKKKKYWERDTDNGSTPATVVRPNTTIDERHWSVNIVWKFEIEKKKKNKNQTKFKSTLWVSMRFAAEDSKMMVVRRWEKGRKTRKISLVRKIEFRIHDKDQNTLTWRNRIERRKWNFPTEKKKRKRVSSYQKRMRRQINGREKKKFHWNEISMNETRVYCVRQCEYNFFFVSFANNGFSFDWQEKFSIQSNLVDLANSFVHERFIDGAKTHPAIFCMPLNGNIHAIYFMSIFMCLVQPFSLFLLLAFRSVF